MAAEQCQPLTEKKVVVIPTKTIPQGVSALLSLDESAKEEELVELFNESITAVHTALVTYAARDSDFDGHNIHAGEYLALYGGSLFGSNKDSIILLKSIAKELAKENKEFITIFYGADTNEEEAEVAADILRKYCFGAEVSVLRGDQPVYYYLISAE